MSNTLYNNLTYLALIRVSGPDAAKFLQGQVTCHVLEVSDSRSRLGACCNLQGRMIAAFRLYQFHHDYYLRLPASILESTLIHLKKYAVFSKVTLTEVSNEFKLIGCGGDTITNALNSYFDSVPHEVNEIFANATSLIACIPSQQPRYEIMGTPAAIEQFIQTCLPDSKIADANAWKLQEILAGIPAIYPETSEEFLPHHVNYPELNGISFNKGCYLGQEIIARMHYRGQSKKHMHRAESNANIPLKSGDKLYNDTQQEVGMIVDAAKDEKGTYQLLVVVQDNATQSSILHLAEPRATVILK